MEISINTLKIRFKNTLESIFSGFTSEFSNENSLINEEILEIIENPSDKKKLDDAVEYLLNHKSTKHKNVELSNKTITISLG